MADEQQPTHRSLAGEIEFLDSLEPTDISQETIQSFEQYLTIVESAGEYEGIRKQLMLFAGYSIVVLIFFSQLGAGPKFFFDISNLFNKFPAMITSILQGIIFSAGGWALAQRAMNPIEKKMFQHMWLRHVSIITFLCGITFALFGNVSIWSFLAWISGAYLGAHLATKE